MQLHHDVLAELTSDPRLYNCGQVIGVGANHGVVTLAGSVASYIEKLAAARAVERVSGVSAVINKLMVTAPSAGLADRDGELTGNPPGRVRCEQRIRPSSRGSRR